MYVSLTFPIHQSHMIYWKSYTIGYYMGDVETMRYELTQNKLLSVVYIEIQYSP